MQHRDQFFDVGHRQAHGGLIQHIQGVRRAAGTAGTGQTLGDARLGQLGDQLDALRLATRQGGRRLPQGEIPQAHILHQLQGVVHGRMVGKVRNGVIHFQAQHLAGVLAAQAHGQRLGVETCPLAGIAHHLHVGQEVHLDGAHALAFAIGAAAGTGIEAEARCGPAAQAGFGGVGKLLAHGVPETHVRSGA